MVGAKLMVLVLMVLRPRGDTTDDSTGLDTEPVALVTSAGKLCRV